MGTTDTLPETAVTVRNLSSTSLLTSEKRSTSPSVPTGYAQVTTGSSLSSAASCSPRNALPIRVGAQARKCRDSEPTKMTKEIVRSTMPITEIDEFSGISNVGKEDIDGPEISRNVYQTWREQKHFAAYWACMPIHKDSEPFAGEGFVIKTNGGGTPVTLDEPQSYFYAKLPVKRRRPSSSRPGSSAPSILPTSRLPPSLRTVRSHSLSLRSTLSATDTKPTSPSLSATEPGSSSTRAAERTSRSSTPTLNMTFSLQRKECHNRYRRLQGRRQRR